MGGPDAFLDDIAELKAGETVNHPKHGMGEIIDTSLPTTVTLTLAGRILQAVPALVKVTFKNGAFWIPNPDFSSIKEKLKSKTRAREAQNKTLRAPYYSAEKRPKNHKSVPLFSRFPSQKTIHHLCCDLGYNTKAARAFFPAPFFSQYMSDRGHAVAYGTQGVSRGLAQPDLIGPDPRAYVTRRQARRANERRQKAADGRLKEEVFMRVLRTTRYDLPMQAALRETLMRGRPVAEVARERRLSLRALSEATRRLRKRAVSDAAVNHDTYE